MLMIKDQNIIYKIILLLNFLLNFKVLSDFSEYMESLLILNHPKLLFHPNNSKYNNIYLLKQFNRFYIQLNLKLIIINF